MELKYSYSNQLPSSHEMQEAEKDIVLNKGLTLVDLMEQAGSQVAAFIADRFSDYKNNGSEILILAGPGNNGGDGLVVGRLLIAGGYKVNVVLTANTKYSFELLDQIEQYKTATLPFKILVEQNKNQSGYIAINDLKELIKSSSLILDCLLGTGQKGEPRDLIKAICEILSTELNNSIDKTLLSVDIPTGINCDSGGVYKCHLEPHITVCIQHLKRGMVQLPALEKLGEIILVDAEISYQDQQNFAKYTLSSENSNLMKLPVRSRSAHKGDFGHVLVLAGSPEMPGAAQLASISALRSGAGLVTQLNFSPQSFCAYPEIMYLQAETGLNQKLIEKILGRFSDFNAVVIGPGLGKSQEVTSFVFEVLREIQINNTPCVVDADALNAIAELNKIGVPIHLPSAVFTPHPGEAARLLQIDSSLIQADRYAAAEALAAYYKCSIVLKGASTICCNSDCGLVNTTGGPFLATAGSGDVLSGMIAAFLAIGQSQISAASIAVYYHGLAGEIANKVHSGPIIASDIIDKIPFALGSNAS